MDQSLSANEIKTTLQAMVVVALYNDANTRDVAQHIEIAVDDISVSGIEAAQRILLSSLSSHGPEWAAWFEQVGNMKPALSMRLAIASDLRPLLQENVAGRQVIAALDRVAGSTGVHLVGQKDVKAINAWDGLTTGQMPIIRLPKTMVADQAAAS